MNIHDNPNDERAFMRFSDFGFDFSDFFVRDLVF